MNLLWKAADGWKDFIDLFSDYKRLTVVTENGTRHFFDLEEELFMRLPGSLIFNPLYKDNEWSSLAFVDTSTACGLYFYRSMTEVRMTSRCVLLYDGFVPELPTDLFTENQPFAGQFPDHPSHDCGARYCLKRPEYVMIVG